MAAEPTLKHPAQLPLLWPADEADVAALADLQHRMRTVPDDLTLPDYGLLTYGIAAGMAIACMLAAMRTGRADAAARWATDAASLTALAIRVGEARRGWPFPAQP